MYCVTTAAYRSRGLLVMRATDGWGHVLWMDALPIAECRYEGVAF